MYAVWSYDLYPFILCGKVTGEPDESGRVKVDGYPGFKFMPIKLVSDKRGKEVKIAIDEASKIFNIEKKKLMNSISERLGISEFIQK